MEKFLLLALVCLAGCGVSRKDLIAINDLLEKSKNVDCDTVRFYLHEIQIDIQSKLK